MLGGRFSVGGALPVRLMADTDGALFAADFGFVVRRKDASGGGGISSSDVG